MPERYVTFVCGPYDAATHEEAALAAWEELEVSEGPVVTVANQDGSDGDTVDIAEVLAQ